MKYIYQYRSSEDSNFEPETHPIASSSLTKCISTAQKARAALGPDVPFFNVFDWFTAGPLEYKPTSC